MMLHQLTWQEICRMIPKRKTDAQKGDFGRLLCITGSRNMPGACLLSTQAALRGGAGLVTVATARRIPCVWQLLRRRRCGSRWRQTKTAF
ncbi:MAG: NAD(P)H-hydrate dehydratase [Ruminococcus sp.]